MSPRPNLGPKPLLGYTANHLARVAERRGDAAFLAAREADTSAAAVRDRRRTDRAQAQRERLRRPVQPARGARARTDSGKRVPRNSRQRGALRHRARSGSHQGAQGAARPAGDRPALDRRPGPRRSRSARAARRGEGAARLARAAPLLRQLRIADQRLAGRLEARVSRLQGRALPAHRSGRDHAGGRRRPLPDGPRGTLRRQHVVVPCGLRRAGREHRGSGAARNARGSRHCLRAREIFRLAAMAVPDVADDRLPRAGDLDRDHGRSRGARGRALVHARRGRADVPRRASGADLDPAADRDRASHHPRLGRGGRCLRAEPEARSLHRHRGARHGVPRAALSAAGCEDASNRVPHDQRRKRRECRGRDCASRCARELRRAARRPAWRRHCRRHVSWAGCE